MSGLKAFLAAHRAALLGLAGALAALTLFWAARSSRAAMDWWVESVSMPVKRALGAVCDPLPFSVCEAGATLLILGAVGLLVRAIWRAAHGQPAALGAFGLHLAVLLLWGYAGVCALWGTQYYAASFAEKAGMETAPVSAAQLEAVTRYFGRQVAACADSVPRDEAGRFAVSREDIMADTAGLYDGLTGRWAFLEGPDRRAKPAFYSKLMSAWGFTGYLCPLTGESTLNVDCPEVFLPVTIAHEYAHQRGVAAEQEANFVGIMASIASGRPAYVYSGWLYGYQHLSNALYRPRRPAWPNCPPPPAPTLPTTTPIGHPGKAPSARWGRRSTTASCAATARSWGCRATAPASICSWRNFCPWLEQQNPRPDGRGLFAPKLFTKWA